MVTQEKIVWIHLGCMPYLNCAKKVINLTLFLDLFGVFTQFYQSYGISNLYLKFVLFPHFRQKPKSTWKLLCAGSGHQGQLVNGGRQCTCIALAYLSHHHHYNYMYESTKQQNSTIPPYIN